MTAYLAAIHAPDCVAILVFAACSASKALDLPLALFTTSCVGRDFEESIWSFVGTVNAVDEEDASKEKRQQADLIHSRLAGWLAKSEERRAVVTLRRNNFLIWKVLITAAGEN